MQHLEEAGCNMLCEQASFCYPIDLDTIKEQGPFHCLYVMQQR